jgi:ribose transport system ATP-binding protein
MEPILSMQGITRRYPGVLALDAVSLDLMPGEVLALVGENGAGKSTLVHILAGAEQADGGTITINGTRATLHSPSDALGAGVGVIYQDPRLVPDLTAAENILLGHEPTTHTGGFLRKDRMRATASAILERLGSRLDPATPAYRLGPADAQLVAIGRALSHRVRILALDEPTAPLTARETEILFTILRRLTDEGVGVLFISHRLDEVFRIAGRVAILRDGRLVHTAHTGALDRRMMISFMVGRTMDREYPPVSAAPGETLLSVSGLRSATLRGISFDLRRGEILGVAGLVGSGRSSLARTLFGAERPLGGTMTLAGRPYAPASPAEAIRAGVALLPEDRNTNGLVLTMNVRENITLPSLASFGRGPILDRVRERGAAATIVRSLQIKTPSVEESVTSLSGGNRQKVVLGRWLLRASPVLMFDEPTAGVDVGARYELYKEIARLALEGCGIIMLSSDLPELLRMCHRICVLCEGRLAGILPADAASPERIMELATLRGAAA